MEQSKFIVSNFFSAAGAITIGINENLLFTAKYPNGVMSTIGEENGVYLLLLLSIDFTNFKRQIDEMIEIVTKEKRMKMIQNFPYDMIVKTALTSNKDHWIELSIPWLVHIGKEKFAKEIWDIQKNKKVSQKVRHRLLKL